MYKYMAMYLYTYMLILPTSSTAPQQATLTSPKESLPPQLTSRPWWRDHSYITQTFEGDQGQRKERACVYLTLRCQCYTTIARNQRPHPTPNTKLNYKMAFSALKDKPRQDKSNYKWQNRTKTVSQHLDTNEAKTQHLHELMFTTCLVTTLKTMNRLLIMKGKHLPAFNPQP